MSDPSTWPTTPPTEPGWRWAWSGAGEAEIVRIVRWEGSVTAGILVALRSSEAVLSTVYSDRCIDVKLAELHGWRWHPQRIVHP